MMNEIGNDRRELVRGIYAQHCEHARRAEDRRLWFTVAFGVVFGGGYVAMGDRVFDIAHWLPVGLLAVFSLVGLYFCLGIQNIVRAHEAATELILRRYSVPRYLPRYDRTLLYRTFSAAKLFPLFFLFCFSLCLFVLLQMGFQSFWTSGVIALIVLITGKFVIIFAPFDKPMPVEEED